ncbi:MAG: DegT/DnrJ/EryC1/StrS family aminotransferase, partial [Bacteroidia bacterium]
TKNIFCQVHYIPVHTMPYYKDLGWKEGDFPLSEKYYSACLSLPMYPTLTNEEQDYVIEQVCNFYK